MTNAPLTLSRRALYTLLIVIAAAMMFGRICAAELVYEPSLYQNEDEPGTKRKWPKQVPTPMPTFSSNDRSRWLTVHTLATEGTYVVGRREWQADGSYRDTGLVTQDGWKTIDKVLRPETQEFYSSKPPLLVTLLAGVYWLMLHCGLSLLTHPFTVVRILLVLVNLLPFVLYLHLLGRLLDRYGTTDWGRLFVFAAAAFATLLTPFAITLNNHSVGTCCVLFALYPALFVWERYQPQAPARGEANRAHWHDALYLSLSGFFAAFAVTNELPAAAFAALLGLALLWRMPLRTLTCFLPAALIPVAAFFLTNYLAVGMWRPAYSEFGGPWYEYAGSHWTPPAPGQTKHGIDWAGEHESRAAYIFHCLLGHHGIFSLSPIWLLAFAGMALVLLRRLGADDEHRATRRLLAAGTLLVSLVVLGFYLMNKTVNYGGWTTGLRWLMWLSPLWLLTMLPLADRLGKSRWGRGVAYVLLAVSVMSVSYPAWNPWRHPWLYTFLEALGWEGY